MRTIKFKITWIVRDAYGWALSFSGREPSQVDDAAATVFDSAKHAEDAVAGAPGRRADYSIESVETIPHAVA